MSDLRDLVPCTAFYRSDEPGTNAERYGGAMKTEGLNSTLACSLRTFWTRPMLHCPRKTSSYVKASKSQRREELTRPIPLRRRHAVQVTHEEILHPPPAIRAAVGVAHAGNDDELEILARFDEGVYQAER